MFRRVPSIEKISKCIGWRATTPRDPQSIPLPSISKKETSSLTQASFQALWLLDMGRWRNRS